MPLILHIETATAVCSVALSQNGKLIQLKESHEGYSHASELAVFINDVLQASGKSVNDLDAIAVSFGPGSYTGLRIGLSAAKGLCYAADKPLISVPTLLSLTYHAASAENNFDLICPMIDARRMEVYCAVYDSSFNEIQATEAKVVDESSFSGLLDEKRILFCGDGAEKCTSIIQNKNAVFRSDIICSAKSMIEVAENKLVLKSFENTALCEPFYLKEFRSGK